MPPIDGYFDVIFGVDGDRAAVPDAVDPSGYVSFTQGYPIGYEIAPGDPGSLPVERDKMNQLFYDITSAIQAYQQFGTPPFITSAMNGGAPFSYSIDARVVLDGVVYESLQNTNTDTPPSSKWTIGTAVTKGGTGRTSLTAYNLLIGNGTSSVALLAPSSGTGIPLVSQGSSSNPAYTTAEVVGGGTGKTTFTAYAPVFGGTGATSPLQSGTVGTTGQVLTSNGAGALPTFQAASSGVSLATVFATFWPVGSLYWNKSNATNPSSLLGFGTWTQIQDKFMVARGSTYTSTGGSATASISLSNLPSTLSGTIFGNFKAWDNPGNPGAGSTGNTIGAQTAGGAANNCTSGSYTMNIGGSGSPISTLPPYQAAYCWERVA